MKKDKKINFLVFMTATLIILTVFVVPTQAKQVPKGHVVYVHLSGFGQVGGDPASMSAPYPFCMQAMFNSLVTKDTRQDLLPALATKWSIAPDWKYIDFHLRDDVKFHNGAPVTAEDIKYSIEAYLRKDLKFILGPSFRRSLGEIEILGPTHIRLHLKDPFPGIWTRLWWGIGIFPKAYREKVGDKGFAEMPVGTGPFKWANDWKQDVYWRADAVPNHFLKTPEIKSITVRYVIDNSTRLAMLKAGEADIVELVGPHIPVVKRDPDLKLLLNKHVAGRGLAFTDLAFPDKPSPFHDIRVREAVSLAIDREIIAEKILFGQGEPYGGALTPITLGYDPKDVKPDPYDPERALELLKQAGYPDGFETMIHTMSRDKFWFEAIAANLNEVGIKAKVKIWERGAYVQSYMNKKLPGIVSSGGWYNAERWSAMTDTWYSKAPWCYHSTPEIDKAINEGMWAITDEETAAVGRKIQALIKKARIKALLWSMHQAFGIGPRISHFEPTMGITVAPFFEYIKLKE